MKEENILAAINEIAKIVSALEKSAWSTSQVQIRVHEALYPPNPDDFKECDTCRAKPGSPELCSGCLHNRDLIQKLKK